MAIYIFDCYRWFHFKIHNIYPSNPKTNTIRKRLFFLAKQLHLKAAETLCCDIRTPLSQTVHLHNVRLQENKTPNIMCTALSMQTHLKNVEQLESMLYSV